MSGDAGGRDGAIDPELTGAWAQSIRLGLRFVFAAVLLAALAWPLTNLRRVQPDSRAVVLRFGRVVRVAGPGLLLALPPPLERVVVLPAPERQLAFAIATLVPAPSGSNPPAPADDPRRNAAFLLTGDGVVHASVVLFCRIADPAAYMLQTAHVAPALVRLTTASLVGLAAAHATDALVVTQPQADAARLERLRTDLAAAINARLADLAAQGAGLGITVARVDLGVDLPADAEGAFQAVLDASQNADAAVARARGDAARVLQQGRQQGAAIRADAAAAAAERRAAATGQTAAITSLAVAAQAEAGQGTPATVLLTRLYRERMAAVLHAAHSVIAVDPDAGAAPLRLILPGKLP